MKNEKLSIRARAIRKHILRMVSSGQSSHVGTALSCADILTVLYFSILNINPKNPVDPDRDRFILSKGHGCTAQYATLAERGFFNPNILETYYQNGGLLGHATCKMVPGMEVSTGSLGHGLGLGVGMAYAAHLDSKKYRVFVVMGDGECNEGSVWEAALAAPQWGLDNLVAVIDYNQLQGCGKNQEVLDLEPFKAKWESFRWAVRDVDGHDTDALLKVFQKLPFETGKPSLVIAHTTKGKGVSFMENRVEWHYKSPNPEQHLQALKELSS